jgi:hypothetical protein
MRFGPCEPPRRNINWLADAVRKEISTMSYSLSATRGTKGELEIAIRDELAKVPVSQPVHEADIDQAFNAAKSLLDLMHDDPARDLYCSVSGSIWKTDAGVENISLNISVSFQVRKP